MLELYFNDATSSVEEQQQKLIEELLIYAAEKEGVEGEAEVSVTFMTDYEIQKINAEYRGIDKSTDVISFALEETSEDEMQIVYDEKMPRTLGDIIISVETAKAQAVDYGHDLKRELGFLALHGFLHLLGYDHLTEEDEKRMFGRQNEILTAFGLER
ncbi:rRNA maturation RNase YbeY [Sporosarcina sp. CAU 1771]